MNENMRKSTRRISVRITQDEYESVYKQLAYFDMGSVSELIRAYIRNGLCLRYDYNKLHDIANKISEVGIKFNQIAREANSTCLVTTEQI